MSCMRMVPRPSGHSSRVEVLPIALDVEGGDNAPDVVIEGARRARDELSVPIVMVGRAETLEKLTDFEVFEAAEVITMDEDPASSVRSKRDSSLVRCAELVRDKKASAMISAGNTGAAMASALLKMGRIKGVARPAIATTIPVPGSTPTVLLDSGANSECLPSWLVQFGQMGSIFAREAFDIANPMVGLMSIGEEKSKGNSLVKETHQLLDKVKGITFIGNVEGRDVMSDRVDVVVTDGFTGNVVLKTLEGGVRAVAKAVIGALQGGEDGPKVFELAFPKLLDLWSALDPDSYGGAMLLGVNGVCVISHGSSSANAIFHAIRTTSVLVNHDLVGKLSVGIAEASVDVS